MRYLTRITIVGLITTLVLVLQVLLSAQGLQTQQPLACQRAQREPIPYHIRSYELTSGAFEGTGAEVAAASRNVVHVPGAPWLRLHFRAYHLGKNSCIAMTSLKDGSHQELNAVTLPQWRDSSAYFNGDAVEVELHVAPGDSNVYFRIEEVTVGDWVSQVTAGDACTMQVHGPQAPQSICGTDQRVASTDAAVGRIVPVGCTGFIASNGAHITAGHCMGSRMDILEFAVPTSQPDGTINHPDARHQYVIDDVWGQDNGLGDDWAVFSVHPGPTSQALPIQKQNAFYRMAYPKDSTPSNVRVTGYGVDGPAPCYGDRGQTGCNIPAPTPVPKNSDSQSRQTASGTYLGEAGSYATHRVDTQPGNSGSPISNNANGLALAIHTSGGCDPPDDSNGGTSFENDDLERRIARFPASGFVHYVDNDHPAATRNGSIFRPWPTIGLALSLAFDGDTISIVRGSYDETLTITEAITLTAPVTVTIGE